MSGQRRTRRAPTRLQGRQRELSWALHNGEGYIANVAASLDRNARHMTPDDLRAIKQSVDSVVVLCLTLRRKLTTLA